MVDRTEYSQRVLSPESGQTSDVYGLMKDFPAEQDVILHSLRKATGDDQLSFDAYSAVAAAEANGEITLTVFNPTVGGEVHHFALDPLFGDLVYHQDKSIELLETQPSREFCLAIAQATHPEAFDEGTQLQSASLRRLTKHTEGASVEERVHRAFQELTGEHTFFRGQYDLDVDQPDAEKSFNIAFRSLTKDSSAVTYTVKDVSSSDDEAQWQMTNTPGQAEARAIEVLYQGEQIATFVVALGEAPAKTIEAINEALALASLHAPDGDWLKDRVSYALANHPELVVLAAPEEENPLDTSV